MSLVFGLLSLSSVGTFAQDSDALRRSLSAALPQGSQINEITPTPIPGVLEVRFNRIEIVYADSTGAYLLDGNLLDIKSKTNLTSRRVSALTAIKFADLPVRDSIRSVRGDGKRKLAVFVDPNCGFCKRFEHELAKIDNITVYTFLYPILGQDSTDKAKNIWCAKDKAQVFNSWMKDGAVPPTSSISCDTAALDRNLAFGKENAIQGTPTLFYISGNRSPGYVDSERLEKLLSSEK